MDRYYWLRYSAELRPKPQKSPQLIDMIILRDMNQTRLDDGLENGAAGEGVFLRMLSRVRRNTVGGTGGERGDYELADLEERLDEVG